MAERHPIRRIYRALRDIGVDVGTPNGFWRAVRAEQARRASINSPKQIQAFASKAPSTAPAPANTPRHVSDYDKGMNYTDIKMRSRAERQQQLREMGLREGEG